MKIYFLPLFLLLGSSAFGMWAGLTERFAATRGITAKQIFYGLKNSVSNVKDSALRRFNPGLMGARERAEDLAGTQAVANRLKTLEAQYAKVPSPELKSKIALARTILANQEKAIEQAAKNLSKQESLWQRQIGKAGDFLQGSVLGGLGLSYWWQQQKNQPTSFTGKQWSFYHPKSETTGFEQYSRFSQDL